MKYDGIHNIDQLW